MGKARAAELSIPVLADLLATYKSMMATITTSKLARAARLKKGVDLPTEPVYRILIHYLLTERAREIVDSCGRPWRLIHVEKGRDNHSSYRFVYVREGG